MKEPRNPMITPRGGWQFTDPLTGVPFREPDLVVLLQAVKKSRQSNGIALTAGWDNEVTHQVCEQNPHINCLDTEHPDVTLTGEDVRRFINTLLEVRGHDLVSDEEHRRRADICLRCPKIGVAACAGPCGWLTRKITEITKGRKLHRAPELHKRSCLACKCDLTTKTFYPLDVLKSVDQKLGQSPDYWSECWMRE